MLLRWCHIYLNINNIYYVSYKRVKLCVCLCYLQQHSIGGLSDEITLITTPMLNWNQKKKRHPWLQLFLLHHTFWICFSHVSALSCVLFSCVIISYYRHVIAGLWINFKVKKCVFVKCQKFIFYADQFLIIKSRQTYGPPRQVTSR